MKKFAKMFPYACGLCVVFISALFVGQITLRNRIADVEVLLENRTMIVTSFGPVVALPGEIAFVGDSRKDITIGMAVEMLLKKLGLKLIYRHESSVNLVETNSSRLRAVE